MAGTPNSFVSPQTLFSREAIATTAETTFHTPTNVVTLLTEADNVNGARITSLYAIARAAIAAVNNCQIYKKVGTTYTLIDSALLGVVTPSATVANGKINFNYADDNPLEVEPGVGLAVAIGTSIANGVVFRCSGGLL
jgi:DNA uptake protein ComE-like DNA-binding protein